MKAMKAPERVHDGRLPRGVFRTDYEPGRSIRWEAGVVCIADSAMGRGVYEAPQPFGVGQVSSQT